MTPAETLTESIIRLSPRIEILPIVHGSGDVAQEVRETLIRRRYDCLAVPLPPSCEEEVERAVALLPSIHLVVREESPEQDQPSHDAAVAYIPIDPCQAVIMGIRVAMGEGIFRAYLDREVAHITPTTFAAPDPYALKSVPLAQWACALLPTLPAPEPDSPRAARIAWMAFRLHELELDYQAILCLCPLADWPWVRDAYRSRAAYTPPERVTAGWTSYPVDPAHLYFALGELPYLTEVYERRRAEVRSDRHVSIDGLKELLVETRTRWLRTREDERTSIPDWVTPHLLQRYLQYVRNLALLEHRLTPDLYTLVLAAKQVAGDAFAIQLLETAKSYAFQEDTPSFTTPSISIALGKVELPDGSVATAKNLLPGAPLIWRSLTLRPTPTRRTSQRWALQWDPSRQCSWPPEDQRIESFTAHVRDQAKAVLGADLARVEKFSTSFKDGLDIRETLRHWHDRRQNAAGQAISTSRRPDIYVKEIPPSRGGVEVVVFLFDTPADPAVYSWHATWYAEHQQESTLAFYASPFFDQMVGPGVGQSRYGGALFLFPPRAIPDIWTDRRLDFCQTLEERLIGAAALHSRDPHIALVTPVPPSARWRQIARRFDRRLIPIPLSRFSGQTIDRLRRFHVLNGHEIRSYASKFIQS